MARKLGHSDAQAWLGVGRLEAIEQRVRHVLMRSAVAWSFLPGDRIAVLDRWTICQYAAMRARGGSDEAARRRYATLPWPETVAFLDVPPEVARTRLDARGWDVDELAWLEAADTAYRSLPEWAELTVVDGTGDQGEVLAAVLDHVRELPSPT